jgi:NTE family protein
MEQVMASSGPRIGIALGSGGARGLAHIPYIEALDEMGLTPSVIAGTSIGALIGAGWASGMAGAEIRDHSIRVLSSIQEITGRLWLSSQAAFKSGPHGISIQADPRIIVDAFLPDAVPDDFAALRIPLRLVATDYDSWEEVMFDSGALRQAVAASLAIPTLFRPVRFDGRLFIDGGATNPLPVDHARQAADIVVGIDVNGMPDDPEANDPNPFDAGFVATQIMTQSIVRQSLALHAPEVYVRARVKGMRTLEFWRVKEIIAQAEADKDAFKQAIGARIDAYLRTGGSEAVPGD